MSEIELNYTKLDEVPGKIVFNKSSDYFEWLNRGKPKKVKSLNIIYRNEDDNDIYTYKPDEKEYYDSVSVDLNIDREKPVQTEELILKYLDSDENQTITFTPPDGRYFNKVTMQLDINRRLIPKGFGWWLCPSNGLYPFVFDFTDHTTVNVVEVSFDTLQASTQVTPYQITSDNLSSKYPVLTIGHAQKAITVPSGVFMNDNLNGKTVIFNLIKSGNEIEVRTHISSSGILLENSTIPADSYFFIVRIDSSVISSTTLMRWGFWLTSSSAVQWNEIQWRQMNDSVGAMNRQYFSNSIVDFSNVYTACPGLNK